MYRYPVKGLSPEPLDAIEIDAGEMLPGDRIFAIENGSRDFDPINPKYFSKAKFLQLMNHEQLAALQTAYDPDTATLRILRDGKQVAAGNLGLPVGRQMIEQFLAAYLGANARGTPRVVAAEGHRFADVPDNFISLINLATVRDIERVVGRPVDRLRFRANIYVDGWQPWQELDLVDKVLEASQGVRFKVEEPITRCAATNVDPQSGARDMQIPRTLNDVFGHEICGLYLSALSSGALGAGETFTVSQGSSADRGLGI